MSKSSNYDTIDSIVTNLRKEWSLNMPSQILQGKWEEPIYSKKQIIHAGKILSDRSLTTGDKKQVLEIINNWRASHAYPLNVITNNLRKNNKQAIVVQRLKRLDSIIGKLERYPNMSLYRMGDLGGCRVIVNSIDNVYDSVKKYKNSRIRHILKRETDYIQKPKASGYRSYHLIYEFHSDRKETYNKNMLIEIQFRTQLQHIWATAVEMMGIYSNTALKSSMGDEKVLRFFVLVSSVFAKMENMPICPGTSDDYNELVREIKEIDNDIHIVHTLSHLNVLIEHSDSMRTDNHKKISYYVLVQKYEKKIITIYPFSSHEIDLATATYNKLEEKFSENVVLVSATSFDNLKAAYPNYFVDIGKFIEIMRRILA